MDLSARLREEVCMEDCEKDRDEYRILLLGVVFRRSPNLKSRRETAAERYVSLGKRRVTSCVGDEVLLSCEVEVSGRRRRGAR